jgi:hypothetical protein
MATIASLLRERVSLQVNSVDRIFLAGYVPKLQSEGLLVPFLLDRGFPIPSPAVLGKISQSYVRAIERFASKQKIPVVHFKRGESKEQTARVKRQAEQRGVSFEALDNGTGFAQSRTSTRWRASAKALSHRDIERFWRRWEVRLPSPFTADDRLRGYRYELSVRQFEGSDTRVFERPAQGREWFELMIGDQLTLGRPDQVELVFGRKITSRTPGRFRTRVITDGVQPQIQAYYKHSKVVGPPYRSEYS